MKQITRFSLMACAVALFFVIGGFLSQGSYAADSIILTEDGVYNISELELEEGSSLSIRANVTINVDKDCTFPSIFVSSTPDNTFDVVFKGNKTMTITGEDSTGIPYFNASNAKSLTIEGIKLVVEDKQYGISTKYLTVKNAILDFNISENGNGINYSKDVTITGTTIKISGCQHGIYQWVNDSSQAPPELTISDCSVDIDAKYNPIDAGGPTVIRNSSLSLSGRSAIYTKGLTLSNVSGRLEYSTDGISSGGDLKIDNTNLKIIKVDGQVIGTPAAIALRANSVESLPDCIMDYSNYIKTPENSRFEHTDTGTSGEHKVLLDGDGNIALDVVIEKQEIPMDKCMISAISNQKYTGSAITPAVEVKYNGDVLTKGKHYKVSYKNNTNAGKATVTVTGIAPFTGTASKTFTIAKAVNPLKISKKTATVKFSKLKKKAQTLAVTKVIKFTNKGQGTKTYKMLSGNKKITINKTTGKVTVKKGLKKGAYKVKVEVKAAGNSNYKASGSKKVTFTVKVK